MSILTGVVEFVQKYEPYAITEVVSSTGRMKPDYRGVINSLT